MSDFKFIELRETAQFARSFSIHELKGFAPGHQPGTTDLFFKNYDNTVPLDYHTFREYLSDALVNPAPIVTIWVSRD